MGSELGEPPWHQLHPGSVAVNLLPRTWAFLRNAWPLLLLIYVQGGGGGAFELAIAALFFMQTIGRTIIHFLTLRYRVNGGRLEIRTGLLNRQVRVIDPLRIQNTELARNVAHRLTGLVEVRIETASGTEVEGLLSALTTEDAEALVHALEAAKERHRPRTEEAAPEVDVVHNDIWDLVRYGATDTRFGAVVLLILGLLSDGSTWLAPEQAESIGSRLDLLSGTLLVVAVITGAWLFGTANGLVRHWGFTLSRLEDRLTAMEGLLSTRRVELRLHKVQLVLVTQPLVRRVAGFGSVHVETAAAREDAGGVVAAQTTIPVVDTPDLDAVIAAALPESDVAVGEVELQRPHPRALYRVIAWAIVRTLVWSAIAAFLFGPWGWLVLVLLPMQVFGAWLDFRFQGWLVTPEVVVARRGWWNRRTSIISRAKMQSLERNQGPIQRLLGLAFLRVRVAGNSIVLPEIALQDADDTVAQLSGRHARLPSTA